MELLELNIEQCLKSEKTQKICITKNVFSSSAVECINKDANNYLMASNSHKAFDEELFVKGIF